jgi:hypothetical protein
MGRASAPRHRPKPRGAGRLRARADEGAVSGEWTRGFRCARPKMRRASARQGKAYPGARSSLEKLRVAEALEQLPAPAALAQSRLGWSAVRGLTWVAMRGGRGQVVGGARPDPRAVRHVLRFEVMAETYALFHAALRELRRRSSSCFGDDAALLEMGCRCPRGRKGGGAPPGGRWVPCCRRPRGQQRPASSPRGIIPARFRPHTERDGGAGVGALLARGVPSFRGSACG